MKMEFLNFIEKPTKCAGMGERVSMVADVVEGVDMADVEILVAFENDGGRKPETGGGLFHIPHDGNMTNSMIESGDVAVREGVKRGDIVVQVV